MRIIHTADWHLCNRLGRIDRTGELRKRVERVAELCLEHEADVLVIAGDLFAEQALVDQMTDALDHIRCTFRPFFDRGGIILAITGNHDRDERINIVRAGMLLASPIAGQDGNLTPGRMYLLNGRALVRIADGKGQRVQFVLLPYPFPSRYDLADAEFRSKEEENRLLQGEIAKWVRGLADRPEFEMQLPTVLVGHLHIRGSETHSLYKLKDSDDVLFEFADLNPGWAYVALGHIHKPQTIGGLAHVRYSGSLDRHDFGETHGEHAVLMLDIDQGGLQGDPIRLPIAATPFHEIAIADPATDLPELADKYPDRETAIVKILIHPAPGGMSRDEVVRRLCDIFPHIYDINWCGTDREKPAAQSAVIDVRAGFATTVRGYLNDKLADDGDRDSILALAESFLAKAGAR